MGNRRLIGLAVERAGGYSSQPERQLINDIRTVLLASARLLVCWKIDVREWHRQCYRMASYFDRQVGAPSGPTLDRCA
jgi:hypothetical protein